MPENIFEGQVEEYFRYNGFFLIRDYVIHFEGKQAQEIDFVGVRLPYSIEQTVYSNGNFSTYVFEDDYEKLFLHEPNKIILLVAEVTESKYDREIKKRINYLRDKTRIGYALQRLGIINPDDVSVLLKNGEIRVNGANRCLTRILFVLNDKLVNKYRERNTDIVFISQSDVISFIKKRAKINIKERGRAILPPWLHHQVNLLLHRS
jgi:hypothetical protein